MPRDNSDLNRLRTWIACKYVDRVWYVEDEGDDATAVAPPKRDVQTAPPGRRKIIHDEQPQQDLFGGGSWDAFASNENANHNSTFHADFGSASVANDATFQADFGVQQQPTMVDMPREQKLEADFAAFGSFDQSSNVINQQEQQTDMFNANYDLNLPNQAVPNAQIRQQQMQPSFQTNFEQVNEIGPQGGQQNMFEANFDQVNQTAPNAQILQQQIQPSFQANFGQMNDISQQQQNIFSDNNFDPSNQTAVNLRTQQHQTQPPFQASFDQSAQVTSQQLQQNMFSANFDQLSQTNNMQSQQQKMITNFDHNHTIPSNMPNDTQNVPTAISQSHGANVAPLNTNTTPPSPVIKQPTAVGNANYTNESSANQTPDTSNISHEFQQPIAVNPNAFGVADKDKNSAFDAFEGLSLEPTPGLMERFETDNYASTTLVPPPVPDTGVEKSTKVQEITIMLDKLSLNQLSQVHQFIMSLSCPENAATTKSNLLADSAEEMKSMVGGIPTQMKLDEGSTNHNKQVPMQQYEQCSHSGMPQMQHMGMGPSTTSIVNGNGITNPGMSIVTGGATSSSNQSHNNQMGVSGTSASNPTLTLAYQGAMNFNSQKPSQLPASGMGQMQVNRMGSNMTKDLSAMQSSTSRVSESMLPPIEKEGNPFDTY